MNFCTSSARRLVRDATEKLEAAGVPEPAASAEVLLSELLGIRRGEIAQYEEPLTSERAALYEAWIRRRLEREPVQRILGYAYFRNLKLELNEHALIPRPDTESVVDAALEAVDRHGRHCRVLDIGTGSGAIAIAIAQERPSCEVHATDISEGALEISHHNAELNGAKVRFHKADIVSGLDLPGASVDVLVSNPPYVATDQTERLAPEVLAWDPDTALFSGPDELLFYRRIFAETPPLLTSGADVVLEIGDTQAQTVLDLGRRSGFEPLGTRPDLAGTPRAALLRWTG
jgi:release factor glutamine methyltransferase